MVDVPENIKAIADQALGMAQRVALRIAGMPLDKRESAFAIAERSLRESAKEMGVTGDQIESFIELQMKAIWQITTDIDVSGRPRGGNGYLRF